MNCSVLYRYAEEEAERQATLPGYHDDTFAAGYVEGAMAALGILGMAWELYFRFSCPTCTFITDEDVCPRCGMQTFHGPLENDHRSDTPKVEP